MGRTESIELKKNMERLEITEKCHSFVYKDRVPELEERGGGGGGRRRGRGEDGCMDDLPCLHTSFLSLFFFFVIF